MTVAPSDVATTRPSNIHSMVFAPSRRFASKSTSTVYMPMVWPDTLRWMPAASGGRRRLEFTSEPKWFFALSVSP